MYNTFDTVNIESFVVLPWGYKLFISSRFNSLNFFIPIINISQLRYGFK